MPPAAPNQSLQQQLQQQQYHQQLQQQLPMYRNGDTPPPMTGGGGGGGGEKTPSPLRETFGSTAAAKGKKMSTPMRKKSIVDEIIPEFPTSLDLNVPELV